MGAVFAHKAHIYEHAGLVDFSFPALAGNQVAEKRVYPILDDNGLLVTWVCIPIFDNSSSSEEERNTFDHLYSAN